MRDFPTRRQFVAYFFVNGLDMLQLGVHVCLSLPDFELHVPFGFFRIGWVRVAVDAHGTPIRPINWDDVSTRCWGLQERYPAPAGPSYFDHQASLLRVRVERGAVVQGVSKLTIDAVRDGYEQRAYLVEGFPRDAWGALPDLPADVTF